MSIMGRKPSEEDKPTWNLLNYREKHKKKYLAKFEKSFL